MKTIKAFIITMFFLSLTTIGGVYFAYQSLMSWKKEPVQISKKVIFHLPKGTQLRSLANSLEDQGLITNGNWFRTLVRIEKTYPQFKAGKYRFEDQTSPQQIVEAFIDGKEHQEIMLNVTIPEGFTAQQIFARLEANEVGNKKEYDKLMRDPELLKKYEISSPSLEGYLFPNTYHFYEEMPTPTQAIEIMLKEFFKQLPENYMEKLKAKNLSLHDAVVFASLIEKETLLDDERPLVSEVIWSRLNQGSPLGIDAALIYGIDDYNGDIKWEHLRDKKNPYNTRIHKGLPPTPIASPSKKSLEAVLTPTNHGYFYYVKMVGETKKHHFSKTLKEHNVHVQKLIKASKKK